MTKTCWSVIIIKHMFNLYVAHVLSSLCFHTSRCSFSLPRRSGMMTMMMMTKSMMWRTISHFIQLLGLQKYRCKIVGIQQGPTNLWSLGNWWLVSWVSQWLTSSDFCLTQTGRQTSLGETQMSNCWYQQQNYSSDHVRIRCFLSTASSSATDGP